MGLVPHWWGSTPYSLHWKHGVCHWSTSLNILRHQLCPKINKNMPMAKVQPVTFSTNFGLESVHAIQWFCACKICQGKEVKGRRSRDHFIQSTFPDRSPNMVLRLLLHPKSSFVGGASVARQSVLGSRKHERLFPHCLHSLTLLGDFLCLWQVYTTPSIN